MGDTATHPAALDVGKKLLGYLATRRETPGVETMVRRITLDDGTVVEASFTGDQPAVTVYAADGTENCSLYVESGMLDLGPNIAADAGTRFNPGPPAFDDSYATLLFGDGVDCKDGVPGLNGRVKIDTRKRTVRSECLPRAGSHVRSRLRDPAKKKAQAMLPASCWSGLMQRYVQAVYGGVALNYSGTPTTLTVEGAAFGVADNWGLLNLGGDLRFVRIDDAGVATLYAVRPKDECFSAVLSLWRSMPERNERELLERRKVLTIALSGCVPGKVAKTIEGLPTGNRHFPKRSAWVFDHDNARAVGVLGQDGMATCYTVTFNPNGGNPTASVQVVKQGKAGAMDGALSVSCASPFEAALAPSQFTLETAQRECHYDFPVYAYFSGTSIEVISYTLIAQRSVASATPRCVIDRLYDLTADFGIPILTASSDANQFLNAINEICIVAEGYYAPSWSAVDKQACFIDDADNLRPSSTGEVHGVASPLSLRTVSRNISSDAGDHIGWQCFWDGCNVFSAYPRTLFSEPKECGFKRSATVDTSSEVSYGTSTAGGAVNFSPVKGSLFVSDCNTFISTPVAIESNISGTFTVTDYDVFGFEGQGTAIISSIASLAWGSCSAVVSERYAVNGGKGFFYKEAKTQEWGNRIRQRHDHLPGHGGHGMADAARAVLQDAGRAFRPWLDGGRLHLRRRGPGRDHFHARHREPGRRGLRHGDPAAPAAQFHQHGLARQRGLPCCRVVGRTVLPAREHRHQGLRWQPGARLRARRLEAVRRGYRGGARGRAGIRGSRCGRCDRRGHEHGGRCLGAQEPDQLCARVLAGRGR
ncbi:hypothetical protein LJB71_08400 [Thermomonas sp. S9]|uniref:hypothetical protein n=1 Tax=Thermomonas sp. S9 TaxID=2885203 RepID=UPI00216ADC05|nr:hypothetical protein [Thermomonas sp. S9]MCR6496235.1 hypothetical protein [Thermomonas sp. S9]